MGSPRLCLSYTILKILLRVSIHPNKANAWKYLYHKNMSKKEAIKIYNRLSMVASHPKVHHVHCLIHHHSLMAPDEFILSSSSFFSCRIKKSSIHEFIYIFLFFFQNPSDEIMKNLCRTNDFLNYLCHLKDFLIREKYYVDLWISWYWS